MTGLWQMSPLAQTQGACQGFSRPSEELKLNSTLLPVSPLLLMCHCSNVNQEMAWQAAVSFLYHLMSHSVACCQPPLLAALTSCI